MLNPHLALALALACAAALPAELPPPRLDTGPTAPPRPDPLTVPTSRARDEELLEEPSPYPRRPTRDPHHPAVARAAAKRARKAARRLETARC